VIDHMQTENDLRRALQRDELELHYQPIINMHDRSIAAMEALLRWRHPERGLVGPVAFIPVAEESRLILPIGRWVLEEACREAATWQARRPDSAPIGISVNLSARELADPLLEESVARALETSGIVPSALRLELTESTLLEHSAALERTLQNLKGLGVGLVLDDFGVGFSSLGYLKRLPLSAIKLDRSFVENLAEGSEDVAIVRAVTDMAEALDMGVVAEGIETPEQLEAVEELGCGYAQGFHFSRPVPADMVEDLLSAPDWAPA
jgi:EAL domain-containing protein (putative c-di-GMP-specific phosphodiesterase class I)